MSCFLYFLSCCLLCGLLMQTHRVKLKVRYSLTFVVISILFLIYVEFPVCGHPVLQVRDPQAKVEKWDLIQLQLTNNKLPIVNGRELFDKYESIGNNFDPHGTPRKQFSATRTPNNIPSLVLKKEDFEPEINDIPVPLNNLNTIQDDHYVVNIKDVGEDYETLAKRNPYSVEKSERVNVVYETEDFEEEDPDLEEEEHDDEQDDAVEEDEDYENDAQIEEMNSPKYNGSEANKAPKLSWRLNRNSVNKDNFLYQINMAKSEREKYFYDNYPTKQLLPHYSSDVAKFKFQLQLPWWEIYEIDNYPKTWYVGENTNKKLILNHTDPNNFGFDLLKKNDGGIFKIVKGDHLEYRYEILEKLGRGSYGVVVRARDHALPESDPLHLVAVKIMHNDSSTEKYFKLELDLMEMIRSKTKGSEHFSTVLRTFFFRNHLCIVMELLKSTLEETRNDKPVTDLGLLRKYTSDVLNGLVLLHEANIIHGDLKPENLMLARNCNTSCPIFVKVVDFSLSCMPQSADFKCPGAHFQTRLYRAPEVSMNLNYTVTADMWSLGVILAELYMNKIPFYGETNTDQLAAIMEVMGLLPPYMVETSPDIDTYQSWTTRKE